MKLIFTVFVWVVIGVLGAVVGHRVWTYWQGLDQDVTEKVARQVKQGVKLGRAVLREAAHKVAESLETSPAEEPATAEPEQSQSTAGAQLETKGVVKEEGVSPDIEAAAALEEQEEALHERQMNIVKELMED